MSPGFSRQGTVFASFPIHSAFSRSLFSRAEDTHRRMGF